jgi:DsbC/DsbD-like thiol-disulfide interchange protein
VKSFGGVLAIATIVACGGPVQNPAVVPPSIARDDSASPANSSAALRADVVPIGNPNRENVVVVAAAIFPAQARPGDLVTLAVRFRTASGWHFFAVGNDDQTGPVLPTTLELDLPAGISTDGDWDLPEPDIYDGPTGRGQGYAGDITFRRRLKIEQSQSPGAVAMRLKVRFQACDDHACLRPSPVELRLALP